MGWSQRIEETRTLIHPRQEVREALALARAEERAQSPQWAQVERSLASWKAQAQRQARLERERGADRLHCWAQALPMRTPERSAAEQGTLMERTMATVEAYKAAGVGMAQDRQARARGHEAGHGW